MPKTSKPNAGRRPIVSEREYGRTDLATLQAMPPEALLSIREAATYLRVSPKWVQRAIDNRLIESVKLNKLVRVERRALDEYVERQTRPAEGLA